MKKLISFVLAAFMCICFAACSSDAPETQPEDNTAVSTEEIAVTPQETPVPSEETVSAEETVPAEETVSQEDTVKSTAQETDNYHPQIQDIRKFLVLEPPYDVCMGDFGSMDFMYSLKHYEEELIQQFIDKLVINNYGLNLVDIETYDYESAYYKSYQFMYRGKGERNLQRENMDWDVSIALTTHKDSDKLIAGIYYVNGFELVDDGHRADYSKVDFPADNNETTSSSASAQQSSSASADKTTDHSTSANAGNSSSGSSTTPDFERNDLPDHSKLQCLTCHGDGDCNKCGGSIYVYVGGARTKCNSCKGSGNCRTCGGSGTRD